MKKIIKILALIFLITFLTISSFLLYLIISTKNIKFDRNKLNKNFTLVDYYDINNCKVYQNTKNNFCNDYPIHLCNAFISVEDKRFYMHKGIDYKRLIKATLVNFKEMSFIQGGSTISQQLIKNTHLSTEKTLKRKFIELKLTKNLEKTYTKQEILSLYLNNIYFGENCYGINSASQKYFNKIPNKLTIAESAMLAGIVKAPSKYNPIENLELANKRKNLVLKLMKKYKFINEIEFNNAINEKIKINNNYNKIEPSYLHEVNKELTNILNTPYVNKKIKVYTYLNSDLQKEIASYTTDIISDKKYIIIDNESMGIKAYYSTCSNLLRQPASTIKPLLVYAPCYQENIVNLQSKILDKKTDFGGYSPSNYNEKYYGYVSCKEALSKSLNVPSVKLLNLLGIDKSKQYATKFNIQTNQENLSLALGNLEKGITLQHLTSCYSTFANQGNYSQAKFIKEIKDENGKTIYKHIPIKNSIFTPETSYLINLNLMDCVKNGTARKLNDLKYQICAKTGTNGTKFGNTDAYCISYTTKNTIGIWLGSTNGNLLTNNCTGSTYPTSINKRILNYLYKTEYPNNFEIPKNIVKVKLDKNLYDKNYETIITDNENYFDGYYIKGTEPTKSTSILPSIKHYKIIDNKSDLFIFYDKDNCDGIYIYELINNNKNLVIKTKETKVKLHPSNGNHQYIITPYKIENNQILYGSDCNLPPITIINSSSPSTWWEE